MTQAKTPLVPVDLVVKTQHFIPCPDCGAQDQFSVDHLLHDNREFGPWGCKRCGTNIRGIIQDGQVSIALDDATLTGGCLSAPLLKRKPLSMQKTVTLTAERDDVGRWHLIGVDLPGFRTLLCPGDADGIVDTLDRMTGHCESATRRMETLASTELSETDDQWPLFGKPIPRSVRVNELRWVELSFQKGQPVKYLVRQSEVRCF